jgi:hypothetical protein
MGKDQETEDQTAPLATSKTSRYDVQLYMTTDSISIKSIFLFAFFVPV